MFQEKTEIFVKSNYEAKKECLIRKLREFAIAFEDSEIGAKSEDLVNEVEKLKLEQIKPDSHFGHILGQLNAEAGFSVRLKKLKEQAMISGSEEDRLKMEACEQRVLETISAVRDYLDLCLSNKDYFYGEISGREGYFDGVRISPESKQSIESLNAKEFVLISRDIFEEKNKTKK